MTKKLGDLFLAEQSVVGSSINGPGMVKALLTQTDRAEVAHLRRRLAAAYEAVANKDTTQAKLLDGAITSLDSLVKTTPTKRDYKGEEALGVFKGLIALMHPDVGVSSNFKYADFIVYAYAHHLATSKAPVKTEDLYKITQDLVRLSQLPGKDIDDYLTFDQLAKAIRTADSKKDGNERRLSPEKAKAINEQTTVLYDGPEGKIVIPHRPDTCRHWCNQTRWCIGGEDNQGVFGMYSKEKPIIIFLPVVSKQERQVFKDYRSFKFALVDHQWYDELDTASAAGEDSSVAKDAFTAPESLEKLKNKLLEAHPQYEQFVDPAHYRSYKKASAALSAEDSQRVRDIASKLEELINNSSTSFDAMIVDFVEEARIHKTLPPEDRFYDGDDDDDDLPEEEMDWRERVNWEIGTELTSLLYKHCEELKIGHDYHTKIDRRKYANDYSGLCELYFEKYIVPELEKTPSAINVVIDTFGYSSGGGRDDDDGHKILLKLCENYLTTHLEAFQQLDEYEYCDYHIRTMLDRVFAHWEQKMDAQSIIDFFPSVMLLKNLSDLIDKEGADSKVSLERQLYIVDKREDIALHHLPALNGNPEALVNREAAKSLLQEKLGVATRVNTGSPNDLPPF